MRQSSPRPSTFKPDTSASLPITTWLSADIKQSEQLRCIDGAAQEACQQDSNDIWAWEWWLTFTTVLLQTKWMARLQTRCTSPDLSVLIDFKVVSHFQTFSGTWNDVYWHTHSHKLQPNKKVSFFFQYYSDCSYYRRIICFSVSEWPLTAHSAWAFLICLNRTGCRETFRRLLTLSMNQTQTLSDLLPNSCSTWPTWLREEVLGNEKH